MNELFVDSELNLDRVEERVGAFKMAVSEKELVKMLPMVKPYSWIFYEVPASVKDLKEIFLPSKLWRLNNLYKVVGKSESGDGLVVDFVMNWAQLVVFSMLMVHPRVVVLKSRQRGVSTLVVLIIYDDMLVYENLRCGVIAQDQGSADGLVSKVGEAWKHLDKGVKALFGVNKLIDNNSEFGLSNGSTIEGKLSFRSGTLHRLLWTEVGKIANTDMKRITETKSGSLQTIQAVKGNYVVLESTAEGDNDFKWTYDNAEKMADKPITYKQYRPVFISWLTDLDCRSDIDIELDEFTKNIVSDIEEEYSEYVQTASYKRQIGNMIYPEGFKYKLNRTQKNWLAGTLIEMNHDLELFYREYPHTPKSAFYVSNEALWYQDGLAFLKKSGRLVSDKGAIEGVSVLHNPDYEVFCFMDIGSTDLWYNGYFQIIPTGDYDKFGNEIWRYNLLGVDYASYEKVPYFSELMYDKPFSIDRLFLPHDAAHERAEGDTIERQFQDHGWDTEVLPRSSVLGGILNVRRKFKYLWIDMVYAGDLYERVASYKKRYDKVLRRYTAVPVHDDASHGADMLRYAMSAPYACSRVKPSSGDRFEVSSGASSGFSV